MPQDEADDSVYNDEAEMVTVYSDVKIGSVTDNITVLEDTELRIPSEFANLHGTNHGRSTGSAGSSTCRSRTPTG